MSTSAELERRSVAWEQVARAISRVDLDVVLRLAGSDTWIGPTADEFTGLIRNARQQLAATALDAARRSTRWRLEAQAARARELAGQPS